MKFTRFLLLFTLLKTLPNLISIRNANPTTTTTTKDSIVQINKSLIYGMVKNEMGKNEMGKNGMGKNGMGKNEMGKNGMVL